MLIIEGPDGSGKTTLVEALQEEFDLPVSPRVVSKDAEAMVDLRDWVDQNLNLGFQRMIFDRHRLISEPIYGPILRQKQELGFDSMHWFGPRLAWFYQIKPIIIYCLPPLHIVENNLRDDQDNLRVAPHTHAIYSAYVARASLDKTLSPGLVRVWDYENSPQLDGLPLFFNNVYKQIKERS